MAKEYNVWITVEEIDEEEETYEEVDLDFGVTYKTSDIEDAVKFANRLHEFGIINNQ